MRGFVNRGWGAALSVILLVVVLITLINAWSTSSKLSEHVECQTDWNQFLYVSITRNRESSSEAALALDELIDAVTQAKSTSDTRAALERYREARAKQKETQRNSPLPPAPKDVCDLHG